MEDSTYETLGGLIVHHTENIPSTGEVIEIDNYQFTILKESTSKIEEVYLKVLFKEK
jgi:Mg2+/Co2+ transporter CorB